MTSKDKQLFIIVSFTFLLVAGIVAENLISVTKPKGPNILINVDEVKDKLQKAGIQLHPAKFWKEISGS